MSLALIVIRSLDINALNNNIERLTSNNKNIGALNLFWN